MIRKWASKFSKSVNKRVVARRRELHVPIKIIIKPGKQNTGSLVQPLKELSIRGETKDLSVSGIAFIVSYIRIDQYYLVGENRPLEAELTLPAGKIKMQILGKRYEQVGDKHLSVNQYLIGAQIVSMTEADSEIYKQFLHGKKRKAGTLKLGVDEST